MHHVIIPAQAKIHPNNFNCVDQEEKATSHLCMMICLLKCALNQLMYMYVNRQLLYGNARKIPFPHAAPAGDNILTESDAVNILEELREAQNSAHLLGFMFRIEPMKVDAICQAYQNPKERLYQIILVFLRQAEPPPTWRAILNALKSPLVNLTALAKRVEAAHFPDPTASRDPPTTSGESVTDFSNTQFTVVSSLVQ